MATVPGEGALALPESIRADMRAFGAAVAADETFRPADLKLRLSPEEVIARLSGAYDL